MTQKGRFSLLICLAITPLPMERRLQSGVIKERALIRAETGLEGRVISVLGGD